MKLLLLSIIFTILPSTSWAWKCSSNCSSLSIFSGKLECMAWKGPRMDLFKGYISSIEASCSIGSLGGRGALPDAKKYLVRNNYFTNNDFNGLTIKWCSLVDWGAAGMVTSPSTIILGREFRHKKAEYLIPLLGHEMVHIKQIKRMGFNRWSCEYGNQILKGNKWSKRNYLEKEAYNYEDGIVNGKNLVKRKKHKTRLTSHKIGKFALQADNGNYLSRCAGCIKGAIHDHALTHVKSFSGPWAQWDLFELSNGKYILKADNGTYLSRCAGCVRNPLTSYDAVTLHVRSPLDSTAAQWSLIRLSNGKYKLRSDNGRYMNRCDGCLRGVSNLHSTNNVMANGDGIGSSTHWKLIRLQ